MTEDKEVTVETNGQEENAKTENSEDETELDIAIIRQVEYYFGDVNLHRDKFLQEQIKLDDGWVPLEILTKFNRLAKLTEDTDVIANALNKSTSGLLEVSEDNKKVRRNPEQPLPEMNEELRKEICNRSIYAKGFAKDASLDDLLNYFKQFQEVENVIMRRYVEKSTKKRLFKGSVFATFKTREQAEKFMNAKGHKYGDNELLTLWQEDYLQQKQEEYSDRKDKKEKKNKDKEGQQQQEKEELKLPTGSVFHFSEVNEKMKREDLKDALTKLGAEVAYIDFKSGDTEGWVRLSKENAAKEMVEKIEDGKIKICDSEVIFKLLEGDDEKAYLAKTVEEMTKKRRNMRNNKFGKGKNFKGRQGGRKRKPENNEEAPPKKVQAQ